MNNSIHRISLDIHNTGSQVSISANKRDTARSLHITLTENGKPYRIAEDCSAVFYMKKPADINGDRATVYNHCNIEGNLICYDFVSANTENAGVADCEVTLTGADGRIITSPHFTMVIDETLIDEDAVVGTNEFSALVSATAEAKAITAEVEQKLANGDFVGEKGEKGDKGDQGIQGEKGDKGEQGVAGKDADPQLFANAVKGSAEGESVRLDDVSPVEHNLVCKVESKNLFNNELDYSMPTGTTYTYEGGTLTITGYYASKFIAVEENTTYTFTCQSTRTGSRGGGIIIRAYTADKSAYTEFYVELDKLSPSVTVSVPKGYSLLRVTMYAGATSNSTDSATYTNIQLEKGNTTTEYTPYVDPATVTVTRYGADETDNLQTYTPNADGTVEGITSLSPTMTLLTDTEGAVIHCEYNRDTNKALGGAVVTKDGTVVSQNADFAEVAEWADGNPNNEDRTGYFVCANVPLDGIVMRKATSIDDVKGVSILAPAFAGNYSKDKLDSNGNLLPKYSYVAILGFVPVIDNGTCTVGGRCMPDDNGCAIPSSNSMGYQVVNRIDENRVLIIIEPNGDMVQRIKTKINKLQEDVDDLAPDQTYNPKSPNAQSGLAVAEAVESAVGGNFELIETIEITEEGLAEITRNSEPSGNPYNFKDVYITFKWYNGSESGKWVKIRVKVDGKTTDAFRVVSAAKLAGSWIKTVYQNGHRIFMLSDATTNYGYGAYYTQIPEATIMSDKPIEAVTILHQTAFTAGTVIEIWGVRA